MNSDSSTAESYCLVGRNGEIAGMRFTLSPGMTIGRMVGSDLFLPDPNIGRLHCLVEEAGEGLCLVLAHRRGEVRINKTSVRRQPLHPGDRIDVGRFELGVEVLSNDDSSPISAPAAPVGLLPEPIENGPVLAARLHCRQMVQYPELAQSFGQELEPLVQEQGGRLILSDPIHPRVVWDSSVEASRGARLRRSIATAFQLHRYLHLRTRGEANFSIGIGDGGVGTMPNASAVWGEGADRALALALTSQASATVLDRGLEVPEEVVGTADATPASSFLVGGMRREGTGRRRKLTMALPCTVSNGGQQVEGLVARASYDPETLLCSLTVLTLHAVDAGEHPELISANGAERLKCYCESCLAVNNPSGLRLRFETRCTHEQLSQFFGFSMEETDLRQRPLAA
ncbi:hypothetical protein Pan216_37590 [Planctomycetes bacterium Pan216]|uniref:FHA domain-containing protein n=1 Tax=Kolteria novifilia TaxID=2527975 RepID=A0A518B7D7_9BACT|nr:hypothetical protein Pan216_37590 [Planctomycetes bacterium Pan216]